MNNLPIIILVLSFDSHPYDLLMKAQQETFDSLHEKDVNVIYYHGGEKKNYKRICGHSCEITYPCNDNYFEMQWKFKLALDDILLVYGSIPFMLFRTNSSSYINKERLKEFVATLPEEKVYAGWSLDWCVSGAGMVLSRDCCEILARDINPGVQIEEDVLIGAILKRNGISIIDDKSRFDIESLKDIPLDRYHYRLKSSDRNADVNRMYQLHQLIMNK